MPRTSGPARAMMPGKGVPPGSGRPGGSVGDPGRRPPAPDDADAPRAAAGRGGTLYVVATPIGNLGDITLRAVEVLREVPLVAAEDTRMTRRLWARHGIRTRLVSYHARNAERREPELLAHLADGHDLALVTDAGTPLVSDPGASLVARWVDAGGAVVALPGPSAVLAALVASGIPAPRWAFEGFLPRSGRERRERLARIAEDERATVLFEAPGRVAATLRDLADACGEDRMAAVCRELTKLHEEVRRGSLGALRAAVAERPPRGEVALVVAGRTRPVATGPVRTRAAEAGRAGPSSGAGGALQGGEGDAPPELERAHLAPAAPGVPGTPWSALDGARARVADLVRAGMTRSAAARQVAGETGLPRRELFRTPGRPS